MRLSQFINLFIKIFSKSVFRGGRKFGLFFIFIFSFCLIIDYILENNYLIKGSSDTSIVSVNNKYKVKNKEDLKDNVIQGIATAVDGDTIRIKNIKERIRLILIDAPEKNQKCFDKNSKKYDCGIVSTDFLSFLINGKEVECKYQKKDIYNRYLAVCYIDEIEINEEMLKNGMAIIYDYANTNNYYKEIEYNAQINKVGIWQGEFELPKNFRKRNRK